MENTFKTTMFGGFDKQDVVAYIEKSSRENEERIKALEKANEEATAAREELVDRCEALQREKEEAEASCTRFQEELAASQAACRELEEQNAELAELRREVERLRGIENEYQTYRAHMVDVELEARQRAEELGHEAQGKADALLEETRRRCDGLRAELLADLREMSEKYGALQGDFSTLTGHVTAELRKMDVAASQLPLAFDHLRSRLEALEQEASKS